MSTPFLSEIKIVSFGFAPKGWALCDGQLLPINQNQALFALMGTTYGGNGITTFALPNLMGRAPMHRGNGHTLGESGGEETHTLSVAEMPSHAHAVYADADLANSNAPAGALPAARARGGPLVYAANASGAAVAMNPAAVATTGGNQPHENRQPFLTLNYVIALQGIFPSQN